MKQMKPANVTKQSATDRAESSYSTTDLFLAAFLQARGHRILQILNRNGRGTFVFGDTEDLQQDILAWSNNQSVQIPVRGFVNGVRDLKGLVASETV